MRHGLNGALCALCVAARYLLGEAAFMNLFTILAGTAAVWINLYLPGFVLLYMQVLPEREAGYPWRKNLAIVVWIFFIAGISTVNSCLEIAEIFGPTEI